MTQVQPPRVDNEALPITGVLAHFRSHEVKATGRAVQTRSGKIGGGRG